MAKPLKAGKAGTIDSRKLHTSQMGDGRSRPTGVVKDGRLWRYVGIGWIDEREARPEDTDAFPLVVYPDPSVSHMAHL